MEIYTLSSFSRWGKGGPENWKDSSRVALTLHNTRVIGYLPSERLGLGYRKRLPNNLPSSLSWYGGRWSDCFPFVLQKHDRLVPSPFFWLLCTPSSCCLGSLAVKKTAGAWEAKWECKDHITLRFNHRLFQFCIGFPHSETLNVDTWVCQRETHFFVVKEKDSFRFGISLHILSDLQFSGWNSPSPCTQIGCGCTSLKGPFVFLE